MTLPRPEILQTYCLFLDAAEAACAARTANEEAWKAHAIANLQAEEKRLAWLVYTNGLYTNYVEEVVRKRRVEVEGGTFFRPVLLEDIVIEP